MTGTLARTTLAVLAALTLAAPASAGDDDSAERGWLGVRLQRVSGGLAEALDLKEDTGVLIGQVMDDSPAMEAGLKSGDIVTQVNDAKVGTPSELRDAVTALNAGDKADVHYLRDGKAKKVAVTLGESPDRDVFSMERFPHALRELGHVRDLRFGGKHGFLGVMTQDLDGDLSAYFGAEDGGALVTEVVEDSPAEKLGLRAGDVIVGVAGDDVEDARDLRRAVGRADDEEEVEVVWLRDKKRESGKVALEVREGMGILGMGDGPHRFEFHGDDDSHFGHGRRVLDLRGDREEMRELVEKLRHEMNELREEVEELKAD
ncbi:MAG TPA: PDZ domain-containing protein [bacterium]|nr:PDZ domain-containing protein [bacterium]